MRGDGYSYVDDKDYPTSGEPLWIETSKGTGIGFYQDGKWFWNQRITKTMFMKIPGTVICWKYLGEKK